MKSLKVINNRNEVELKMGRVTHYVQGDGKEFGFIQMEDENSTVFFHHNYQRTMACNGGEIPVVVNDWDARLPYAEVGTEVVFETETVVNKTTGLDGLRAKFWAHKFSYDNALQSIQSRYTFRLRKRIGKVSSSKLSVKAEYKTLWCGKDILQLRSLFPTRTTPLYDTEMSSVFMEYKEKDANGVETEKWIECEDQR